VRGALPKIFGGRKRGFVTTDAAGELRILAFTTDGDVILGDGTVGPVPPAALGPHAPTHENGGADEINVAGLSGVLADPQLVDVDPAGALDGDSATTPLAVRVDNVTLIINGSNQLEAVPAGAWLPLALGSEPLTFVSDGAGQPILVAYTP
jgi:hypothetical protein